MSPSDLPAPSSLPGPRPTPLPRPRAVTRAAAPPPGPASTPQALPLPGARPPVDALAQMLAGSTGWHAVPAPVSRLVTLCSWAVLALVVGLLILSGGTYTGFGFLGEIASLGGNQVIVIVAAVLALATMGVTCFRTGGFRRASRAWLRVWTAGLVLSAVALAPLVAAIVAGIFVTVLFVAVCLAGVALILAVVFS